MSAIRRQYSITCHSANPAGLNKIRRSPAALIAYSGSKKLAGGVSFTGSLAASEQSSLQKYRSRPVLGKWWRPRQGLRI
jgi:hypothetical protein